MIVSTTCTAGSSTEPLGLLAGMSMEIAGFQGRLDLKVEWGDREASFLVAINTKLVSARHPYESSGMC